MAKQNRWLGGTELVKRRIARRDRAVWSLEVEKNLESDSLLVGRLIEGVRKGMRRSGHGK